MERLVLGHRSIDRGDRGQAILRDWLGAAQPEISHCARASVIAAGGRPDYPAA
jgi:hypothetical protein